MKNSMKGLISIKNNDNKFFLWCHNKHSNQSKIKPERITKQNKEWLMILIMKVLNFLFLRTIIIRLNQKTRFALNVFPYENDLVFPVYISDEKFEHYESIDANR